MVRSFTEFLADNIETSVNEAYFAFLIIYSMIGLVPFAIFLIIRLLSCMTKWTFFKNITRWFLKIFTYGVIEHIFISAIKYTKSTKGSIIATEIPKDQSVHRMKGIIFTKTIAKRIRFSAALLFPFQTYILSLVIVDQLFTPYHSNATCETYQQIYETNPMYAGGCLIRSNYITNIPASEFFNPLNALRSEHPISRINISTLCQNSSEAQNEILSTDYYIECTKYFYRWNNIINTLTNALQWHQITIFIIKTNLAMTFSWQMALGHAHWWLKTRRIYRLLVLILFLIISATIFLLYTMMIVAFNKTMALTRISLTFQANAILLIPMLVIPLLFYNTVSLAHWTIRTIRGKKCEQEVSHTFDSYRNVFIYAEKNLTQQKQDV